MTDVKVVPMPEPAAKGAFCPTPTATAVLGLARHCLDHADIGLIVGAPGTGKTTALEHFAREEYGAFLVGMAPSTAALVPSLSRICDAMGATALRTGACEIRMAIVRRIENLPTKCVLLVDEAQHLTDQSLEEIRLLHDETGAGIVLAGNATFPTRFNGKRGEANFAQLTSRIGMRLDLGTPLPEDVTAFCDHHAVRGRRGRAFLQRHADRAGGLRTVAKLVHLARASAGDAKPIDFEQLKAASDMLWGAGR